MIKLYRARSMLYRRQICKKIFVGNLLTRFTRFTCLHRSDLNIPANFRHEFLRFFHDQQFSRNFTKTLEKPLTSIDICRNFKFENNWVTGFSNYQLFRSIDNWGWGFRPGVAGSSPKHSTVGQGEVAQERSVRRRRPHVPGRSLGGAGRPKLSPEA